MGETAVRRDVSSACAFYLCVKERTRFFCRGRTLRRGQRGGTAVRLKGRRSRGRERELFCERSIDSAMLIAPVRLLMGLCVPWRAAEPRGTLIVRNLDAISAESRLPAPLLIGSIKVSPVTGDRLARFVRVSFAGADAGSETLRGSPEEGRYRGWDG